MAFIFMMMVGGLFIRLIAILGMLATAKIDRHLAQEKVEEAPHYRMRVVPENPIIKESLLKASA